jgi:hypothetical protein
MENKFIKILLFLFILMMSTFCKDSLADSSDISLFSQGYAFQMTGYLLLNRSLGMKTLDSTVISWAAINLANLLKAYAVDKNPSSKVISGILAGSSSSMGMVLLFDW